MLLINIYLMQKTMVSLLKGVVYNKFYLIDNNNLVK